MKRLVAAAAVVSVLAFAGACSGSDRPSAEELSQALTAEDAVVPVPEDFADCVSEFLVGSDVSDETLTAIVEGDEEYEGSEGESDKFIDALTAAQEDCVSGE